MVYYWGNVQKLLYLMCNFLISCSLILSYTGFFGLAGHGGGGGGVVDGIHHTFITLVLFDGFELNLVQ